MDKLIKAKKKFFCLGKDENIKNMFKLLSSEISALSADQRTEHTER